jgi:hypothetical protein
MEPFASNFARSFVTRARHELLVEAMIANELL